jgi:hypothetical protein
MDEFDAPSLDEVISALRSGAVSSEQLTKVAYCPKMILCHGERTPLARS